MLVLVAWTSSWGQSTTGSIFGTVVDNSGALIPHAQVTVVNSATGESATRFSSNSGDYHFPVLNPGPYRVTANAQGFTTVTQSGLALSANQNIQANFKLPLGETSSVITVESTGTLVETVESQLAQTVDQQRIVDLPLLGRNAYDLVQLVPGITAYAPSAQIGDTSGTQFSTNGLRATFNSFYLDGAYNTEFYRGGGNVAPAPDALGEFRIITSNFDAEFGRYPGAIVNTITRSGSDTFHGVVYDYLRNNAFNAKSYFDSSVAKLTYNVFGGSFGGPVLRKKLFFYGSYQGTRIAQDLIIPQGSYVVPTDAERTGDFSASAKKPPLSLCPNYKCQVDPVAAKLLSGFVPHGVSGGSVGPEQRAPNPVVADQGTGRLDYQVNQAHHLQFTIFESRGTSYNRTINANVLLAYAGLLNRSSQTNYVLSDIWTMSPHVVNTATGFYTLNQVATSNIFPTGLADLGFTIPEGGAVPSQPQVAVTGYFTAGGSGVNNQPQLTAGLEDTVHWSHGRHEIKFGGSELFNHYRENGSFTSSGKLTFNGNAVVGGVKTSSALVDFIVGHAQSFAQNNGAWHRSHAFDPSLFVQDNYRVTQRLTANLGLRWEAYYPFSGEHDYSTFIPGFRSTRFPTAPLGLAFEGDPGIPEGIMNVSLLKFAPRVGFAFDVFGNGQTSLRGGYGIAYAFNAEGTEAPAQQPFLFAITVNNTTNSANPYANQPTFPGGSPFPYNVDPQHATFNTNATFSAHPVYSSVPYVSQYILTLEQQFGPDWATRISYVGNVGRHFNVVRDENAPIDSPAATAANAPTRRPYYSQGYTASIGIVDSSGNSTYNSLQASVTRRLRKGFSLQAFYVWSRTLDDVSLDPQGSAAFPLADQYNISLDRGLSTIHVGNQFVASFIYQLPAVNRFGLFGKEVLSGWQINGIQTLETGSPFNIVSNTDTNFDLLTTGDRPNVLFDPRLPGQSKFAKIHSFFNTKAYVVPQPGQLYGNSPRNPLVGPGTVRADLSAFKTFPLKENLSLLYRVEAFNAFNNTNLNNPVGTLTATNFGAITGATSGRILQMAVKLNF